jgi:Putative amidoligase enzyme
MPTSAVLTETPASARYTTLQFGVELETVHASWNQVAEAIKSVVGGMRYGDDVVDDDRGATWQLQSDGSLEADHGYYECEIACPPMSYDRLATLQQVVRALRRAGAEANRSCGIHIHVDGRKFPARALVNLLNIVYAYEPYLYAALGVYARRRSQYARDVHEEMLADMNTRACAAETREGNVPLDVVRGAWYCDDDPLALSACDDDDDDDDDGDGKYHDTRYFGVNLHSLFYRGTIEFRYFNGTMHAGKLKAYIQLVLLLCQTALRLDTLLPMVEAPVAVNPTPAVARREFREFLRWLGMDGAEFTTARQHLLSRWDGVVAARETSGVDLPYLSY